jgi:hypothetical protein
MLSEIRSLTNPLPVSNRLGKLFIVKRQWLFQFAQDRCVELSLTGA